MFGQQRRTTRCKCVPNLLVRRISKLWIINEVIIRVGLLSTDEFKEGKKKLISDFFVVKKMSLFVI